MKCAWCGQEIVLTAEEPTFHFIVTIEVDDNDTVKEEIALHHDCKPFWEENNVR